MARWGALNWAFHRSLYEAAGRAQTLDLIRAINLRTDRYIRLQLQVTGPGAVAEAEAEHRELLRLSEGGDARAAVPYLRKHIVKAGRALAAALKEHRAAK